MVSGMGVIWLVMTLAAGCGADLYGDCAEDRDCRGGLVCAHAEGGHLGYCTRSCCAGDADCEPDPEECSDPDAGLEGVCASTDYSVYTESEGVITETRAECAPTCSRDADCPGDTTCAPAGACD